MEYQIHDLRNCLRFQLGRGMLAEHLHRLRNRMHAVRAAGPERFAEELALYWDQGTRSPSPVSDPYLLDLTRRIYAFCESADWRIDVCALDVGHGPGADWPIVDSRYLDDPECKAANARREPIAPELLQYLTVTFSRWNGRGFTTLDVRDTSSTEAGAAAAHAVVDCVYQDLAQRRAYTREVMAPRKTEQSASLLLFGRKRECARSLKAALAKVGITGAVILRESGKPVQTKLASSKPAQTTQAEPVLIAMLSEDKDFIVDQPTIECARAYCRGVNDNHGGRFKAFIWTEARETLAVAYSNVRAREIDSLIYAYRLNRPESFPTGA